MTRTQKCLTTILLFLLTVQMVIAQSYHQELNNIAVNNNLVGAAVVTTCDGFVADSFFYGHADIGRNIPVTDSTLFRVASISKIFTALALMQLYERQLFGLDDNVSPYLGFPLVNPKNPQDSITFRMLLSHTSSIQDGSGYAPFLSSTYTQSPVPSISSLLLPGGSNYTSDLYRFEPPGSYFQYSNLNFGIIGTLVERISGKRFDLYVRDSILQPLGIPGSFNIDHISNIDKVAVLYRNGNPQADNYQGTHPQPFDTSGYTIGSNALRFAPQGGLRTSATGLARVAMLLAGFGELNGTRLLDSTTVQLMLSNQWTYYGNNGNNYYGLFNSWGLGIHLTTNTAGGDIVIDSLPMAGHPGEAYGLISDMYFETTRGFGLVFITNGYYGPANYPFGNSSAFYLPEEQAFTAVKNYPYANCQPNITTLHESLMEDWVDPCNCIRLQDDMLRICEKDRADFAKFVNMNGIPVRLRIPRDGRIDLGDLPPGLYIFQYVSSSESCTRKILVH